MLLKKVQKYFKPILIKELAETQFYAFANSSHSTIEMHFDSQDRKSFVEERKKGLNLDNYIKASNRRTFFKHELREQPKLYDLYTIDKERPLWRFVPDSNHYEEDFENKIFEETPNILISIEQETQKDFLRVLNKIKKRFGDFDESKLTAKQLETLDNIVTRIKRADADKFEKEVDKYVQELEALQRSVEKNKL